MPKIRPAVHISIRIPAALKDKIDRQARQEGRSRSKWLERAAAAALELGPPAPVQLDLPLG